MKKIFNYKLIGALMISFLMLSSCDSFLDVNDHPNKQTDPTLSTLASSAIIKTADLHTSFSQATNRYTQHLSGVGQSETDQYAENTMSGTWYNLYVGALADLDELTKLAEENEASHFLGLAQVLTAANIGAATDVWDAIPYSDALQGNENYLPTFDTQDEIYAEVFRLLDEAIINLGKTDVVYDFTSISGDFDLFYEGDASKWLKMAYAYKARYLLHWSSSSAGDITTAANSALSSNADDADFYYSEQNHSPYYNIALSNNTGNLTITFADYYIQVLNGNIYGTALDPRLAIVADTNVVTHNGVFTGYPVGAISGDRPTDLNFTENCWHFGMLSAIPVMTYAEQQFIIAEVEVNGGAQGQAFNAWDNGVRANMEKLGVAGGDIDDYITDSGVDASNITIADVMKEKYIAMFLQYEAWNDMRRYDYGDGNTTYQGLTQPIGNVLGTTWARRVMYPLTEQNRNGINVDAAKGSDYGMAKAVTWNQ